MGRCGSHQGKDWSRVQVEKASSRHGGGLLAGGLKAGWRLLVSSVLKNDKLGSDHETRQKRAASQERYSESRGEITGLIKRQCWREGQS